MKNYIAYLILCAFHFSVAQNTVGTLTNDSGSYNGYTLFSPNASTETYLINNCGEVVHQWSSTYTPAASVYLLENGNLLRTGKISNPDISFGGVGGHIQLFDWDNNLLWEYSYSSTTESQHHDVYPLPNGNILMLAVNTMSQAEAIQAGRDPVLISDGKIFNEQILELEPVGTNQVNIVWEWNIKDHLIQDNDNTKDNYGIVGDHPELLDFNFTNENGGGANWLHFNSIQYNESLDQIIISSRILSEVYIIDHSTTTAESASHSGGTYGKGGDFLYRWGNPEAYDKGDETNRTLYSQHYPHWIADGLVDEGKIIVFNNGNSIRYSSIDIFDPPQDSPGVYTYDTTNGYGPSNSDWIYTATDPQDFFSAILSSAQRLPNGNTLICDGDSGYFFEIDDTNTIVWEYINPDSATGILTQGETSTQNLVFRALKFPTDYIAFEGRDLTPGDPIELDPDLSGCTLLNTEDLTDATFTIYPNPVTNTLNINTHKNISNIKVYDLLGNEVKIAHNFNSVDMSNTSSGMYIIQIEIENQVYTKKVIRK